MHTVFCDNGFSPKEPDYLYTEEYQSAKQQGFQVSLISFEALKRGDVESAVKFVRLSDTQEIGVYRGWMLTPGQYETLYAALLAKNIELINNPEEYKFCHYLPENYPTIQGFTPKTTYKKIKSGFVYEDFQHEIETFGNQAILVKDYVKSQKHYWNEACFIPNAADREQVTSVVKKFIDLQGDDFNEGLVFREYVELEALTQHSTSGMPLTKEFRAFIKHGTVIAVYKYWDEGDYQGVEPAIEAFEAIIPTIKSNFFTMDIAQKKDGPWIIVELGDGQVAGLPDNADKTAFYAQLK